MKKLLGLLFFSLLFSKNVLASMYFVTTDENESIKILDENNISKLLSLKDLVNSLQDGDEVLFERGKRFKSSIDIVGKSNITLRAYGDVNESLPVIYIKDKIDIDSKDLEIVYPRDFGEIFDDDSWKNLTLEFNKVFSNLATFVRDSIAKSFSDVEDKVYEIMRFKFPFYKYSGFDYKAMRLWIGKKEILKAMLFEELNCDDCEYKIRWFYEPSGNYLYIFSMSDKIELKYYINNLYINNTNYFTIKISNSKNIKINGLDVRDGKYSIAVRASEDVNITDSVIGKDAYIGIYAMNDINDFTIPSKRIVIDHCLIDSDFKFDYRFTSLRNSQDGVFFLNNVKDSVVKNCKFSHWGHTGVNLSVSDKKTIEQYDINSSLVKVERNRIFHNTFDGVDMPYMRAVSFDNIGCENNIFYQNVIKNMKVRSQINGSNNVVRYNIVYNIRNSQVKIDQGYGSGQGFQFEAYGDNDHVNLSYGNVIEKNLIMKTDEAAVSISSREGYGDIEDNNISDNIIIDCGNNIFQNIKKDYNKTPFDIIDINDNYSTIKGNNFISNKIYTPYDEAFVFYRGDLLSIDNFNKYDKDGDVIEGNILFTGIDVKKMDEIDYDADNFVLDDKYLYIYRLYLNVFKRVPDLGGLLYWRDLIADSNVSDSNTSLKSALSIAKSFFFSHEMEEANLSVPEYIERLYNTLLNRKSDKEGFEYWLGVVENNDIKKEVIFYKFVMSDEFKKLNEEYKIKTYFSKDLLDSFVERLYLLILDRVFDEKGRDYWVGELESGSKSASLVVKNFFHSKEFLDKNVSDERFVYLAYMSILDRAPDKEGASFWVSKLESNTTRDEILDSFLNSTEFQNLAKEYSIPNIK